MFSKIRANQTELIIILALFVAGLITRLYNLDVQSLGMDEGATYVYSKMSFTEIVDSGEPNSPTYYVIEGWILSVFGNSHLSIKFLSIFFGALCAVFTYLLSKELFNSRLSAILAAVFVVFCPVLVYYGQEARGFSCATAMVIFQMWLLILALKEKDNFKLWIAFAVVGAVGVHFQYVALMPCGMMYVYAWLKMGIWKPKELILSKTTLSFVLMVLLILPVFSSILNTYHTAMNYSDLWDSGTDYVINTVREFLYNKKGVTTVLFILLLIGSVYVTIKDKSKSILFALVIIVPFAFTYWISTFSHIHYRYVLYMAPLFFVLITSPLSELKSLKNSTKALIAVCCVVLIAGSAATQLDNYYHNSVRGDYQEIVEILEDQAEEGDCIVLTPQWLDWGLGGCLDFYYDSAKEGTTVVIEDTMSDMEKIITEYSGHSVFIITWAYDNEITSWAKTEVETTKIFGSGNLTLYTVN